MNKNFEDHIKDLREDLDLKNPSEGHLDRFEAKLNREHHHTGGRSVSGIKALGRVAAVVTVLAVSVYAYVGNWGNQEAHAGPAPSLSDVSQEMAEVEHFYQSSLEAMLSIAGNKKGADTTNYTETIKYLNDLEFEYDQLKDHMEVNFGDERLVNAMIQNYRARVQIMEELIDGLELVEQSKKGKND